jgi:hypothetical protein
VFGARNLAGDTYDELARLVADMADITTRLLQIKAQQPEDRTDLGARLNYVMEAFVQYRQGVTDLHDKLNTALDRLLES